MKAPTHDRDLSIIALLFMLLLVYCSIGDVPATDMEATTTESVANYTASEANLGTVKILE